MTIIEVLCNDKYSAEYSAEPFGFACRIVKFGIRSCTNIYNLSKYLFDEFPEEIKKQKKFYICWMYPVKNRAKLIETPCSSKLFQELISRAKTLSQFDSKLIGWF